MMIVMRRYMVDNLYDTFGILLYEQGVNGVWRKRGMAFMK